MPTFRNQRGIALLLSVSITAVAVTAALELHRKVRSAVVTTAGSRDRLMMTQVAKGGVHAAMAMLVKDKLTSTVDSLQEDWSNPEKIEALLQEIPFEEGKLSVSIEDERSRIQVNALVMAPDGQRFNELQYPLWDRYLGWMIARHEAFEELEPATILDSLKDWLDSGDDEAVTGLNGAESDYYENLDPPSYCRNGPIRHMGELLRVKGVAPVLFHGIDDIPGLSRDVTQYGLHPQSTPSDLIWDGKININTASLPVLAALLPPESQDLAEVIFEYRVENDNGTYFIDLTEPTWYKSVPGLGDIQIPADLITVSSDLFRITATASLVTMKVRVTAVVQREQQKKSGKWVCRILNWTAE